MAARSSLLLTVLLGSVVFSRAVLSGLDTPRLQFDALEHFKTHCDIHNWITLHRNWCTGALINAEAFDFDSAAFFTQFLTQIAQTS